MDLLGWAGVMVLLWGFWFVTRGMEWGNVI